MRKWSMHLLVWMVVLAPLAAVASDLTTGGLSTLPRELRESAYFNRNRRPAARSLAGRPAPNAEPSGYSASLEDVVVAGVLALQETIDISAFKLPYGTDTEKKNAKDVISYIRDLNGECFNMDVTVLLLGNRNGLVTTVKPTYYTTDSALFASQLAAFRAETAKAMAVVEEGMDDVAKALALHDYIITHCSYNMAGISTNDHNQTAYGALVARSAVCAGYSRAYCHLLKLAGIRSDFVRAGALGHAWNLVDIDGKSYHVDCTWDDPVMTNKTLRSSYVSHSNFLLDDAGIQATGHTTWDDATLSGTSDRFNGHFWHRAQDTVLPWHGGKVYAYLETAGGEVALCACDASTGVTQEVLTMEGRWAGFYTTDNRCFGLAKWRGLLFLSNAAKVWAYLPGMDAPQEVEGEARCDYSATGETAEITGLVADGAALYAVNQKVEAEWQELKQVPWTPVTAVSLDATSQAVDYDGEHESTFTLTATAVPADATCPVFRWSSSDEAVATVDDAGVVTVHGAGIAVITATSCDGGFTAACTVTVTRGYTQTVTLKAGWNLVGVSVVPDAESLSALAAYPLFTRDAKGGAFVRLCGTPEPGRAYWLYASAPAEVVLHGTAADAQPTLQAGWNLLTPLTGAAVEFPWNGGWRWTGRFYAPQTAAPDPGDALWMKKER